MLQSEHGFQTLSSCIDGYMLRALWMMGYGSHPASREMRSLVKASRRWDNGYLCGDRTDGPSKSCMRGAWQVLMAFADVPELRRSAETAKMVKYFLERDVLFRRDDPAKPLRPEVTQTIFPFVHGRASLLEALYALSRLGFGRHKALANAWDMLDRKRQQDGRYILNWTPSTLFPVGCRGTPDKWVTLYALLAKKHRESVPEPGTA